MFREAKHKKSLNQMLKKLNKAKHLLCNEEGPEGRGKGRIPWTVTVTDQ